MADYTAFVEAGTALVEMLRDALTPEPVSDRESISLCSPHESENNQLTLHLFHIEEEPQGIDPGYVQIDRNTQRRASAQYVLHYLVTAHSKAPAQLKEADQHRIMGALVQTVRDTPVIPARYLNGSTAEEGARLHLMVERTNTEQLLKLWNDTTKAYRLSVVLAISGVSISSGRERRVPRVTEVVIGTEEKGGVPG